MKVPIEIASRLHEGKSLCWNPDYEVDGSVAWARIDPYLGYVYGFMPWDRLAAGNGDQLGYYWPIGQEDEKPLVGDTMHDASEILPAASSLACLLRLKYSVQYDASEWVFDYDDDDSDPFEDELEELSQEFAVDFGAIVTRFDGKSPSEGGIEYWGAPSAFDLLPLDPESPHLLLCAAKELLQRQDLSGAEGHVRAALRLLPEYSKALFVLIQILRRQLPQRMPEYGYALINYLTTPCVFGGRTFYEQAFQWLKRLRDEQLPECDDPYWRRRRDLTLVTGVKYNDDFRMYEEILAAYRARGERRRALLFLMRVHELFRRETVSFRERYGWSYDRYVTELRQDLDAAGLTTRTQALG
jgi:tetratricopeptide (TPR) repeat protein